MSSATAPFNLFINLTSDKGRFTTGSNIEEIDPELTDMFHHLVEIEPEDEVRETALELI